MRTYTFALAFAAVVALSGVAQAGAYDWIGRNAHRLGPEQARARAAAGGLNTRSAQEARGAYKDRAQRVELERKLRTIRAHNSFYNYNYNYSRSPQPVVVQPRPVIIWVPVAPR